MVFIGFGSVQEFVIGKVVFMTVLFWEIVRAAGSNIVTNLGVEEFHPVIQHSDFDRSKCHRDSMTVNVPSDALSVFTGDFG